MAMSEAVECHGRYPSIRLISLFHATLSLFGLSGEPSWLQNTRASGSGLPIPSLSLTSSCCRRYCSSSRTALGGRDILLRPCLVLGSLNRRPALVCSRERQSDRGSISRLHRFSTSAA